MKNEYLELRKQCQDFATALLDHTRSSHELEVLLNHDPTGPAFEHGERMHLNRLKLAVKLRQKKVSAVINLIYKHFRQKHHVNLARNNAVHSQKIECKCSSTRTTRTVGVINSYKKFSRNIIIYSRSYLSLYLWTVVLFLLPWMLKDVWKRRAVYSVRDKWKFSSLLSS